MKNKKKIFNELVDERSAEYMNLEIRINRYYLIYKYKTEGISSKDFRSYQDPINLFEDLGDGNINPEEVLKDQSDFKSDPSKI